MSKEIKKVAVIGAGAMGKGIAAQAANAGYEVVLLDHNPDVPDQAIQDMLKAKPGPDAGFMDPKNAKLITTACSATDMHKIAGADLVIEAIVEDIGIKQAVYKEALKYAAPDAILASNTSTIQIKNLMDGMDEDVKARFMNTHFFNPPRFMPLLELIDGEHTTAENFALMRDFGDKAFGKKVIRCKDTPGFIANRIGGYAIYRAITEGAAQGTKIEDIDAIMSPAFGFTRMGLMKLSDFVGLDIMKHVGENLSAGLTSNDDFHAIYNPERVNDLVGSGQLGNKSGGGFYRPKTDDNGKVLRDAEGKPVKEVMDLQSGEFRDVEKSPFLKQNFKKKHGSFAKFFESNNPANEFAWPVLRDVLVYTLHHAEQMSYSVQDIDEAMQTGYNWKWGPFELIDQFGVKWFTQQLEKEGIEVPELLKKANGRNFYREGKGHKQVLDFAGEYQNVTREDGVLLLEDVKRQSKPLLSNDSASLWDIGDGVVAVEFHTVKGNNPIDPAVFKILNDSIKLVNQSGGKYKAMVLHNDGANFSVGANIGLVSVFAKVAERVPFGLADKKLNKFVEDLVYTGQAVYKALREAPFPVIGAPGKGFAFGGGCEALLHCDAVQTGPEVYTGLVEAGVGFIPGWGGCARYLERASNVAKIQGPMQATAAAAMAIGNPMNAVSTSGQNAKSKLWFNKTDEVSMNQERVLADAKTRALAMVDGYTPPREPVFNLPGPAGQAGLNMQVDSMYLYGGDPEKSAVNHVDVGVMHCLGKTLTGGDTIHLSEIDDHIAGDTTAYKALAASRDDQQITVNHSIPLTEARILQLERDYFMTLFNRQSTKDRVAHMVEKNKPLREAYPDERPSPAEIRDAVEPVKAEHRVPDGKPLSGKDEKRLNQMAKTSQRTMWGLKKLGLA